MPKTIMRSDKMDNLLTFRCTDKDWKHISDAAKNMGVDRSTFLRLLLIKEGVIEAQ